MFTSGLLAAIASPSRSMPLCVVRVGLARMEFTSWAMLRGSNEVRSRILAIAGMTLLLSTASFAQGVPSGCKATVYLTIDTGHMAPAEEMAAILKKHSVKATFFLANEKTQRGDTSLDPAWSSFWRARAEEGHAFGTHTWRHWYFRGDVGADKVRYVAWGANAGDELNSEQVCRELRKSDDTFKAMTGRGMDPIWRAPGGKLTPNTVKFAEACGYKHVAWSPAGFSGDELPSEKFPSDSLIKNQLKNIRDGDVLLWHLGIWSRKDALYPKMDDLITGLKAKGFCFARITDKPEYQSARRQ